MDQKTVTKIIETLQKAAREPEIHIESVYLFGSRSRSDAEQKSDVDLLIVSPDFRDVPYLKRSKYFYRSWDYSSLPEPEFICVTPEELDEKKQRKPHIIRTAVEDGEQIA